MESAMKNMSGSHFGYVSVGFAMLVSDKLKGWAKKTEFNKVIQLLVTAVLMIVAAPFALIEGLAFLIASPFAYIIDAARYSKAGQMSDFHKEAKEFGERIGGAVLCFITGPLMNHAEMLKVENMPESTCFIKPIASSKQ